MNISEKKSLRVGIIGLGCIASNHIHSIQNLDGVTLVALCDIDEEKLTPAKATFGLDVPVYTDYTEMIEKECLDSVHILTPHYLHAPMCVYALEHGLDVFLEKPMGISLLDIEQILDAEKKSGKRVCVCFQNRFNATTLIAKEIIGGDGGVLSAYATVIWDRSAQYYAQGEWRGKWATEGGGVMINQAIHTLDLLCQFLGNPISLKATYQNHHLDGIIEVEDMCEGIVNFEGGRRCVFYTTTAFEGGNITTICLKTKNHTITIQNENLFVDGVKYEIADSDVPYYGKKCYGKGHPELIGLFYEALREGKEMPVSAHSAQYALRLLLAAYKSQGNETII